METIDNKNLLLEIEAVAQKVVASRASTNDLRHFIKLMNDAHKTIVLELEADLKEIQAKIERTFDHNYIGYYYAMDTTPEDARMRYVRQAYASIDSSISASLKVLIAAVFVYQLLDTLEK